MNAEEQTILELGDIQSGALLARPSPYSGTYILLRIDDRRAGRELLRRLSFISGSRRSARISARIPRTQRKKSGSPRRPTSGRPKLVPRSRVIAPRALTPPHEYRSSHHHKMEEER
jgi:hypothetical protein